MWTAIRPLDGDVKPSSLRGVFHIEYLHSSLPYTHQSYIIPEYIQILIFILDIFLHLHPAMWSAEIKKWARLSLLSAEFGAQNVQDLNGRAL